MIADEIVKLTREQVAALLRSREEEKAEPFLGKERRHVPRWPFPGAVELRPAGGDGTQQWFATCRDLSDIGMGMWGDCHLEPGTPVEIAFHLPEASFYGNATVRYCEEAQDQYLIGVEFDFSE